MGFLFRLLLLVVVIVGLVWLFREPIADRLGQRARAEAGRAGDGVERGAERAREGLEHGARKVGDLDLDKIAEELKQTGRVVRRKTAGAVQQLDDATRDARTTAKIKARIALDPDLSARDIGVDTTDGRVTLSGRANSAEDVARAIQLALQEDDVVEVMSTIQVRTAANRPGAATTSHERNAPAPAAPPTPQP